MKKTLGLLLTAVTLVALVPKAAGATDTPGANRCGLQGTLSGLCKGVMPPSGGGGRRPALAGSTGKQRVPPVQGGKHRVPPVKG